jgi:hypothetical protein
MKKIVLVGAVFGFLMYSMSVNAEMAPDPAIFAVDYDGRFSDVNGKSVFAYQGGKDCYLETCLGDQQELDYLTANGRVFAGTSQLSYLESKPLSGSLQPYLRNEIRRLADSGDFADILPIISVLRTSNLFFDVNVLPARDAVSYALMRTTLKCGTFSRTEIISEWATAFPNEQFTPDEITAFNGAEDRNYFCRVISGL